LSSVGLLLLLESLLPDPHEDAEDEARLQRAQQATGNSHQKHIGGTLKNFAVSSYKRVNFSMCHFVTKMADEEWSRNENLLKVKVKGNFSQERSGTGKIPCVIMDNRTWLLHNTYLVGNI
jgi:hypothetical protein